MNIVQNIICAVIVLAVEPNCVLTNDDIGKQVKLMNMEYGEILSSFENGEWTRKVLRKTFRQAHKLKMTQKLVDDVIKTTPRLISTKCTTDRPIKLDLNYIPDTNEKSSDDVQENKVLDGQDHTAETEHENTLENDENVLSNEPENNSIEEQNVEMGGSDVAESDQNPQSAVSHEEPKINSPLLDKNIKKKSYIPPKPRKTPDHYIDDP